MKFTEKPLTEVIAILRERGYTADFNLLEENISYIAGGEKVELTDIVIDRIYRFTGLSDLDDESILYALRNTKDGVKGIFVNGYGIYSDSKAHEIIQKISIAEHDGDDWGI
ncbi:hypothetical protein H9Y05_05610 [Crocinitomicaceae bacterium CZZ-1]|uniref:Phosphoribosylpyrophosphate synthetase n=1 Tax=Taishania pollutisoli TaxID=2766479 RepID=A0A8J6U221_9FLAO|nr:hypothetical protein [Taishania pollutisoli]MBC9811950.1 hypothetical protein [Taishania pollutisoli]MBX2949976.1 hypothetical protein [Crocinitomicaceae bacterium]NGF74895.1 hypothetical protein [Fluviicola sp. SGL-29]